MSSLFRIGTFGVAGLMLNCSLAQSLCYGRVIKAKKYEMREIGGHRFSAFCAINLQKSALCVHNLTDFVQLVFTALCVSAPGLVQVVQFRLKEEV